jgi:hypothetical protein
MSNGEPPKFVRPGETNLLSPIHRPREPRVLLAPSQFEDEPVVFPDGTISPLSTARREIRQTEELAQNQELMRVFRAWYDLDPALAAEAQEKGVDLEIDTRMAAENIQKVRELWEAKRYHAFLKAGGNERLLRRMLDPEFASIARDDLENLSAADLIAQQWSAGTLGYERSMLEYKRSQTGGVLSNEDQGRLEEIDRKLSRLPRDSAGHGVMSLVYGGVRMAGGMAETMLYSASAAGAAAGTAALLGQAGPQVGLPEEIITVPAAATWAGLTTLALMSGRQIAGEAYGEMRRLGITHGTAKENAELAGFAGGLLEAGGLRFVGGRIAGAAIKNFMASRAGTTMLTQASRRKALQSGLKAYGATAGAEIGVELSQELVQWGLTARAVEQERAAGRGGEIKLGERGSLGENLSETFWETLRGVAILSSFGPALQFRNDTHRAGAAKATEQQLNEVARIVTESKVEKRNPNVFLDYLQQAFTEEGAPDSVFFDVDTFTEQMTEHDITMDVLEKEHSEVAAALTKAEALGLGEFEVSTLAHGAKFLSTDFGTVMSPHARVDPGGMTAMEGLQFEQSIKEQLEQGKQLMEDAQSEIDTTREELGTIKEAIEKALNDAGIAKVSPEVASKAAELYSHQVAVLANHLGITPAEFEEKHGLRIQREEAGAEVGAEALEQREGSAEFYSALSREVEALPTKATTAKGWKQALTGLVKKGKIKRDEVFWTGVEDLLDTLATGLLGILQGAKPDPKAKITKEKLLDRLQGVQVNTLELGGVGEELEQVRHRRDAARRIHERAVAELTEDLEVAGVPQTVRANAPWWGYHMFRQDEQAAESERKAEEALPGAAERLRNIGRLQAEFVDLDEQAGLGRRGAAKFGEYTLPGGTNYREVLLTLPQKAQAAVGQLREIQERIDAIRAETPIIAERSAEQTSELQRLESDREQYQSEFEEETDFRSPHFDQSNVVAHLRINDRVGPDGEKVLFVEEIQSDWAQAGRKQGFKSTEQDDVQRRADEITAKRNEIYQSILAEHPDLPARGTALVEGDHETLAIYREIDRDPRLEEITREQMEVLEERDQLGGMAAGIPRAPFVESTKGWLNLALKQTVLMAVNEGYDQVAFINGEQSAERYNLSKHVDHIAVTDQGDFTDVTLFLIEGDSLTDENLEVTPEGVVRRASGPLQEAEGKPLEDVVGKEVAKQIMDSVSGEFAEAVIEGEDLAVGGEGMKTFYDSIVPKAVKKLFGKKGDVGVVGYAPEHHMEDQSTVFNQQFTLKITDPLRESVQTEGLPLFAGEQLGRYIPSELKALLTEDANPSTVLHEMFHHFAGVMQGIAVQADAPQAVKDDVDAMMRFNKIEGATPEERLANWNAMSFEEQAPHQEELAYNYELWLFEGTVASSSLRRLFQRIRTFMLNVYTSLVEAQRKLSGSFEQNFGRALPGMTPELRALFERMAAGEQAARHAEAVRRLGPMFETEEAFAEAGNDPKRWTEYQQKMEDAHQQLITDLNVASLRAMKWQEGAKARVAAEIQKEQNNRRKGVKAEVAPQVEDEPIYQVIAYLASEKNGLDRAAVLEMLGDLDETGVEAVKKKLGRKLRAKDGLPPNEIASFFPEAFPTGRDLVAALIAARPLKEEVKVRTAQEMERRYGSPPTEEEIQDRIERAVHNEARARFVAVELEFLDEANRPARVMLAAAKAQAARILGGRQLNDMSPHKFAQQEARAAAAAHKAMKPVRPRKAHTDKTGKEHSEIEGRGPDPQAAIEAKRRQLLYNQLTKLALEAKERVRKAREGVFKQVGRGTAKTLAKKGRDPKHIEIARAILAQYGLLPEGKLARTADFIAMMRELTPELLERFEPELIRASQAGPRTGFDHRNMTLDEFSVLHQVVSSLWHYSKRHREMEVEQKRIRMEDAKAAMIPTLQARGRTIIPGATSAVKKGVLHDIDNFLKRGRAVLTKTEHYMRELDGGEIGPFTTHLFLSVKEAVNAYRAEARVYTKQFVDMLKDMRERNLLPNEPITWKGADGKVIYVFGKNGRSGGMTELIGALMHMGNESNRSKFLVAGRDLQSWADPVVDEEGNVIGFDYSRWDAFVYDLISRGILTKEHFDFVQSVWDLLEEIKPRLQKTHMEMQGFPFKEVVAESFEIEFKDGTKKRYRGGYVPAGVDYEHAQHINRTGPLELTEEQLQEDFYLGLPKAPDGMMQERVESYRKRPLTMDMTQIVGHIDKSLRYAHVEPAAADVRRLLNDEEFTDALARFDPNAREGILIPFLEKAVTQSLYKDGMSATADFFKHMRRMAGVAIMALNPVVTVQQLTGLVNSSRYVKLRYMKGGFTQFLRHPRRLTNEITTRSTFMEDRLRNQMFELTDDMRGVVLNRNMVEKTQARMISLAYYTQATFQQWVDVITWQGAYDQAIENAPEGEAVGDMETRAVREADQAVRLSQGSFSPEDTATYEKGTPAGRAWTQFTSYFNTVLNQIMFDGSKTVVEKARTTIIAFTIPMVIAEAIAMTFYDRWDDEDDDGYVDGSVFAELLLFSQLRGATAMVPALGPNVSNLFDQAFTNRPTMGDRVVASPMHATLLRSAHGMLTAIRNSTDPDKPVKARNVRDTMTFATMLFPWGGAALAPLIRSGSYHYGIASGEVEPTDGWDWLRGTTSGYASPESRTRR